jgi:hypothetical protein
MLTPHLAIVVEGPGPRRPADPALIRDIITDLRRQHAYADGLISALIERLQQDDAALESAARLIVCELLTERGAREAARALPMPRSRPAQRKERQERQEQTRQQAKHLAGQVKRSILMEMPTAFGKPLGDLTEAEGRQLAGWQTALFAGIGDRRLRDVKSEADLQAAWTSSMANNA